LIIYNAGRVDKFRRTTRNHVCGKLLDSGILITASAEREAGCKWLLSFKTYLRPATICCAGVSGK